ncbi:MAG: PAS domain-containing protein [Candidatus Eisenbacteria bacterium]|nr:PAS domain-containing protein [Candidatus Eisenbacteria bacterium]
MLATDPSASRWTAPATTPTSSRATAADRGTWRPSGSSGTAAATTSTASSTSSSGSPTDGPTRRPWERRRSILPSAPSATILTPWGCFSIPRGETATPGRAARRPMTPSGGPCAVRAHGDSDWIRSIFVMVDEKLLHRFLDSLKDPFLFADTSHTIRYMNAAAKRHYSEGEKLLGRSLLDCHNSESGRLIREILAAMRAGEEERLITDNEKHRIYMRAVRDENGALIGYYERYEPPARGQAPDPVS